MKFKTLLIILTLTFFPVNNSYSEINNFYAYVIRNADYWKVINYIIYPCINMHLRNEYKICREGSTTISLIGIYAKIKGKMIWKDKKVKIGKPEGDRKFNYYIDFEIIDSLGNNVCKNPEKAVIDRNYEFKKSTLLIFFKKSFINKLKEGKYKLKTTLYERKKDGKYQNITSRNSEFVFLDINNPIIRDSKASFFAWTGGWTMFNKYRWSAISDNYIKGIAEELLTKAVELNTNLRFVYEDLIELLLEDGKYNEIIKVLDKWVSVRDTAVNLMFGTPLRKDSLPISRRCLREILKEVYGDKAEEKMKKYYSEDK